MAAKYLHQREDFLELIRVVAEERGIEEALVEKDYWIMHCLYGLKKLDYQFQLKGGTSLSKGFGLIDRFSEDIDLHINPPAGLEINENPKNGNANNIQKKKEYYDQLAREIKIDGIISVVRDTDFDDEKNYNSGGIRLHYSKLTGTIEGLKDGILLEAGYDNVTPNGPVTISSWAYDKARVVLGSQIIDNRAVDILCYDKRYTFVEKLQTVATKFRKEQETGQESINYMRQYYDLYSLLGDKDVVDFLGSEEYLAHKKKRFPAADLELPVNENLAFLLDDPELRKRFEARYLRTKNLYYNGQPPFADLLARIRLYVDRM
jgi:hypothetical protein